MKRRLPIISTIIVVAAALLMVRLGFWQLHRLQEKEALLAHYAANQSRPPLPFAALFPIDDNALYRMSSATCLGVVRWTAEAGRSRSDQPGWRHIAFCRTGAEGPGLAVDMGVSQSPASPTGWHGGPVRGRITWVPSDAPLIARLFAKQPPPSPMIVSEVPAPGLAPSAQPDPASIPNNHMSYAIQWFIFAALALIIYGIALRQRARKIDAGLQDREQHQ
jgi:cytochrome oxidase assembly protein ShyY1